jgi:hypothetical protein
MRRRLTALTALAIVAVASCGTSTTAGSSGASTVGNTAIGQPTFVLSEFKIRLDGTVPAGQTTLKIDNQGGETHEVVIVTGSDPAALPKKADGSVDEDKIAEADKVGETGDVPARSSTTKTFTFKPGTYVAFCNIVDKMGGTGSTMMGGGNSPMGGGGPMMGNTPSTMMGGAGGPGHIHFAQGMYTTFTVK